MANEGSDSANGGPQTPPTVYGAEEFEPEIVEIQQPTVYTAEDFEPEVVAIPPPTVYGADDFDPEVVEIARPRRIPQEPAEEPSFYRNVVDYPGIVAYPPGTEAEPIQLQPSEREYFARRLREIARGNLPRPRQRTTTEDHLADLVGVVGLANKLGEFAGEWSVPGISPGVIAAGMILKVMQETGKAQEEGRTLAQRNAWKWGFARTIAAAANGDDWRPPLSRSTDVGSKQHSARNRAIQFLRELDPDARTRFLSRYIGQNGFSVALSDFGGYESTRIQPDEQ
jgi:hypothetical protein